MRVAAVAAGFFLVAVAALAQATGPTFPELTGRIVDQADILAPASEARIQEKLRGLETRSSDQLVVVTLRSLQGYDIADYGYRLGRHWGIGQRGTDNGVLLIVVPSERKVRIEVGYGLEGTLTDALSRVILDQSILPRFRANDYAGGIERGVDDIIKVLTGDAAEVAQRLGARQKLPGEDIVTIVLFLIVFAIVFWSFWHGDPGVRRGRRGPRMFPPGGFGGGGGGGGFGGFSGGGGSFGGGGSSGGW